MRRNGHLGTAMFMPVLTGKASLRSSMCSMHLLLRRCLAGLFLLGFGSGLFMPCSLPFKVGMPVAWSQEGYFTYEIEGIGERRCYLAGCNSPPLCDDRSPIHFTGFGTGHSFFARFGTVFAEFSENLMIRFITYWHGMQAPSEAFLTLRYHEQAQLRVTVPFGGGSATTSFTGNLFSASVSLRDCTNPDQLGVCQEGAADTQVEIHPYYLSFTQVQEGLWKAEVTVPFRVKGQIQGACPPPPLPYSWGDIEFISSIERTDPTFVYVVASNEPSYHKGGDCIAVMNNTTGPLDERYGDTAVELCGERYTIRLDPRDPGTRYTNWYLGNSIVYTRMLHGNWCPGDCPLNEWWVCGASYRDNLFHEFTSVNAVIGGCPKTDCEDWFIGTELDWRPEPSLDFWLREDVQRRVSEILSRLPFKYYVRLKVTDNYGNGPFSDSANYTMVVHAPLELDKLIRSYNAFLPEEGRRAPEEFIPDLAIRLTPYEYNYSDLPADLTFTITESGSYTSSLSVNVECSVSSENVSPLGKRLIGSKFGVGKTITTTQSYELGTTRSHRVSGWHKMALFAQPVARIQEWTADAYGWHGYLGSGRIKMETDIHFAYLWYEEPINR